MNNAEFQELLNAINIKWEIGTDWTSSPSDIPERKSRPEKGYMVVPIKQFKESRCDWCGDRSTTIRTYTRLVGSTTWKAKCHEQYCKKRLILDQKNLFNPLTNDEQE